MTRSSRALQGVMVATALAACGVDPTSPTAPSARPSFLMLGVTETSAPLTAGVSGSCVSDDPIVSGNSTYIVAYADLPICGAPPSDSTPTAAPAVRPDSLSLKFSFD